MLTYELKKAPGVPLYEALYRCLRQDIQTGKLPAGSKLPSKRALSEHLKISKITVEAAYGQLVDQGFLYTREKVGYFVSAEAHSLPQPALPEIPETPPAQDILDLTANSPAHFPFSVWSRLHRQVMLDLGEKLLQPLENQGCSALRHAIAQHLSAFRGMQVNPQNIIIGAGTDFLYNLLMQLLGQDKIYAVEEPGYEKIRKIYAAGGVRCIGAAMDGQGVLPNALEEANILHISPSHHFPTGIVTPMRRRQELLDWAEGADGYIIEDDYDSEFRFHAHPMAALHTLDRRGRVIYMNSFSKSLTPAIRISYMVLPDGLLEIYQKKLSFYSGTVPSFEQYTLARFLNLGYFDKHINRMRRFYKARRNQVVAALQSCPWREKLTILEQDAGLHFLVQVDTALPDEQLAELWAQQGIRVQPLSGFYHGSVPATVRGKLVINYSGLNEKELSRFQKLPCL
ncbi:MAG: PLP-dependent aminotransferase family protein [Ruminococcaceae bacterium]|nr:PLP-dependent aminotransferase family protein [Oscillospiraceae bacterium]